MFTVAAVCLAPTAMFLTARLFSRQRAASRPLALFEWLADALLLLSLTLLLFLPLGRITVSPWIGHPLSFSYGKTTAIASVLMGALLGALQGFRRWRWTLEAGDMPCRPRVTAGRVFAHFVVLLLLFATFAYLWGIRQYPIINLGEIVFHLNVPLEGTSTFFIEDMALSVFVPTGVVFLLCELWVWAAPRVCRRGLRLSLQGVRHIRVGLLPAHLCAPLTALMLGAWLALLASCLNLYLDILPFISSRLHVSSFIEEEYVDPALTAIAFPEEKRNLITIYIESGETTFQDAKSGGFADVNYTPEMTRIAAQNLAFSQSELIQGAAVTPAAGWTIAGLVAQTSGLPLKLYRFDTNVDNMGSRFVSFLPGVTTLGDLLREQGYRNVFMAGSDFTFAGRRQYFTQHGDYEAWDLLTAYEQGVLPESYYEAWGFEDRKLYAYARDVLTELAEGSQPFHFAMLTVDTHTPGYEFDCCPADIDDPYLRIVACASRQLGEFIDWCEQQPFFENTTIVITGDHASMTTPEIISSLIMTESDRYHGTDKRLVYNAFINAAARPVQAHNRLFTTLDFFPTVLASIGVTIEGDRLGLGTNLFSDRKTLAEEYGYQTLNEELDKVSPFYNEHLMYSKK